MKIIKQRKQVIFDKFSLTQFYKQFNVDRFVAKAITVQVNRGIRQIDPIAEHLVRNIKVNSFIS